MSDILELMQLCRFCLVKEKVDVPIFGEANDVKQIFMKISACLPVKVSRDDNLPKNICDDCVNKIETLYQFWNTTVASEKQLIQWLGELGVNVTKPSLHSIQPETVILKEEKQDPTDETIDLFGYNQQFNENVDIPEDTKPSKETNNQTRTSKRKKAPVKRRGRPPGKKAEPKAKKPMTESSDDDSFGGDAVPTQDDSDDELLGNRIAKQEQESEDEFDNTDALEPTTYIDVPSETADNDQPGPSGINKPAPISATDVGQISIINVISQYGSEEETKHKIKHKRHPKSKNWIKEITFSSPFDAEEFINKEGCWSGHYKNQTLEGLKKYYRCNLVKSRDTQCSAEIYLLYDSTCFDVHLFRKDAGHDHHIKAKSKIGLSETLKIEIRNLYFNNYKPKAILYELSKNKSLELPNKYQLTNYIQKLRKEFKGF